MNFGSKIHSSRCFFFWCAFAEEISWLMIVKAQLSQLITQQVVGVSSQATHPTSFFANGSFQSRDSHFVRVRSFSSAPSFLDPHLVLLPLIFILILILLVLFLVLDLLLFSICFSSSFSSFYSSITSSSSSSLFQICVQKLDQHNCKSKIKCRPQRSTTYRSFTCLNLIQHGLVIPRALKLQNFTLYINSIVI